VVEVLVLVNSRVVEVRETWTATVMIQMATFFQDGNVPDPALPTPLSIPAMWLKTTSTKRSKSNLSPFVNGGWDIAPAKERTSNDFDTCGVAGVYHVFVLFFAATLRLKFVAGNLVVGPPLGTLNMLICGVHLDGTISCSTDLAMIG